MKGFDAGSRFNGSQLSVIGLERHSPENARNNKNAEPVTPADTINPHR